MPSQKQNDKIQERRRGAYDARNNEVLRYHHQDIFRNEHNPPHIHAIYGEHNGLFSIADMQMLEGDLPARAVKLVQEWGTPFTEELLQMWNTKQLRKLPPLK